jgi:asparagine synthase (glutamine-hydrolysing)
MSMLTELAAKHVKVCLSGEGADEVFAGYLYFFDSPTPADLHHETVRKVRALHSAQVQFVDRLTMMNSLEGRVPFLDLRLLETIFAIRPEDKLPVRGGNAEKHMLRSAFEGYLPASVLWRQKEQFGDGVGFGWIDAVKEHATQSVSDDEFARASSRFPRDTPTTKEQYFYRAIFDELFPYKHVEPAALVTRWAPWSDPNKYAEPSGRAVGVHNTADLAAPEQKGKIDRVPVASQTPYPVHQAA